MFGIEVIRRKENYEVHLYMSVKVVFNDAFYSYLVGVFECCDGEHEVAGGKVGLWPLAHRITRHSGTA